MISDTQKEGDDVSYVHSLIKIDKNYWQISLYSLLSFFFTFLIFT